MGRSLLDVDTLDAEQIEAIVADARELRGEHGARQSEELRGRSVVTLFYEPSTRTRVSFELAAQNLGATTVHVGTAGSSVEKGESLIDTVRTLNSLGADALVLRHPDAGAPYLASRHFHGAVINAGDGRHAHPTQALLDVLTLSDAIGCLRGAKVAIVGDIVHGRVARSTALALHLLGAHVVFCGPPTLLPLQCWLAAFPCSDRGGTLSQTVQLGEALEGASAVIALRLQKERQANGLIPSVKQYVAAYGLTRTRLEALAPGAVLMHPGPANEGVEVSADLMQAPQSLIGEQVANGVLVRMAVLRRLLSRDE